jgi:hypothetical protein
LLAGGFLIKNKNDMIKNIVIKEHHLFVIIITIPFINFKKAFHYKPLWLIYKQTKYKVKSRYNKLKKNALHAFKMSFEHKKIYVHVSSVDCDHVSSDNFCVFKRYKDYINWLDDPNEWDWVEGRVSVKIIKKDEYDFYKKNPIKSVDYALRAFENGHPYTIKY